MPRYSLLQAHNGKWRAIDNGLSGQHNQQTTNWQRGCGQEDAKITYDCLLGLRRTASQREEVHLRTVRRTHGPLQVLLQPGADRANQR